ncbi:MAG: hypothetical protein ACI93R_000259 [Flavobacteriales bacterium]
MKRDLIFIALVALLGMVGLIYSNQSTDEIDTVNQPSAQVSDVQANNGDIYYKKLSQDYANAETGKILDDYNNYQYTLEEELDEVTREESTDTDTSEFESRYSPKAERIINWRSLFDKWQLVLIDSLSQQSSLINVETQARCSMEFSSREYPLVLFTSVAVLQLNKSADMLIIEDAHEVFIIDGLSNPGMISSATVKLIEFCKANPTPLSPHVKSAPLAHIPN